MSMGRPAGSTNGRRPRGGYPDVEPELGGFLAGFVEGEGSFGICQQSGRSNYHFAMALNARDDDAALLRKLARSTRLGRVNSCSARGVSNPQVSWSVNAKADCLQLIKILDAYPLRGRKSKDYANWSAAVQWWCAGDPTATTRHRDWSAAKYLKDRLQEARRFTNQRTSLVDEAGSGLCADWPDYLAGLYTAEGSFVISRSGLGLAPRAQVMLRCDDIVLLEELRERTNVGRVNAPLVTSGNSAPAAGWFIRDRIEMFALVELFDHRPPRGRKRNEYEIWREAVLEYGASGGRNPRLRRLRAALRAERKYDRCEAPQAPVLGRNA